MSIGNLTPRREPFPTIANVTGRRIGAEELDMLRRVLESGALNCNTGTFVTQFERQFAEYYQRKHCVMVTSGTAAIHIALGALDLNPGDEVITAPITDMGTICPILLVGAVPVFADLDPNTFLMDPASIEANITARTRAIMPVHLAGFPCDMDAIRDIAKRHGLPIIEDCAQAYRCGYKGKWVGQLTEIGCFSLNQGKHITCGDGGMIVTDDDALAKRARLFADKGWPRAGGVRDTLFLSPNYRVTELQAGVAIAQLDKLEAIVADRQRIAERVRREVQPNDRFRWIEPVDGAKPSYWFLPARMDAASKGAFMQLLSKWKLPLMPGYIPRPVYLYTMLRELRTFGDSGWPVRDTGRR